MDLVVDANVLFAALIRAGATAKLMFLDHLDLHAPEFLIDEFSKHRTTILTKSRRSKEEFDVVLQALSDRILFIPKEEIIPFVAQAEKLSPDSDDAIYFAVALRLNASIWSNDSRLKEQDAVDIYNTSELIGLFSRYLD